MSSARTLIYTGGESLIYVENAKEGKRIRKVLHAVAPDLDQIQRFHNEVEFTKDLNIPGVRHSYGIEKEEGQYTILLEYIEGNTLEEELIGKGHTLASILDVFVAITAALGELHEHGIVHKDINGKNILWKKEENRPVIIDFGISSKLDYISNNLGNPDKIKGTLTHIPPEQSGRVNRKVDSRSDLYSLGITLYHVLTGKLPFYSDDSLELVHAHIAKRATFVHILEPEIPEVLSMIVAKLMAKDAEDRYQTAFGLQSDLEKCRTLLEASGAIPSFTLGENDQSGKFQIPQRLYGREQEVQTLLRSFERVSRGSTELFLVGGYSGVGKSALIAEIYKPITERRGFFVGGKFDQYQRNIPYSAIVSALTEFCDLLLTEKESSLNRWRDTIQQAVGQSGIVLTEVVPALTYIIGEQPEVPKLEPQEAQNRFNFVFQNFIRCVAKAEHPFVLFCDDLQWADTASLNLIRLLVSNEGNPYLLVIGAYRDNEIHAGHQLTSTLEEARKYGAEIVEIELLPLTEAHLSALVTDTLHLDTTHTAQLTELVFSKTLGNAFFTLELMRSLNQLGFIKYDRTAQGWNVNIDAISKQGISSNVVELLISKLAVFPKETQDILKMASCIGGVFDLQVLADIGQQSLTDLLTALWPAVLEGLIVPMDDAYQVVGIEDLSDDKKVEFQFSHDRVQQAAYSLMQADERDAMHVLIGRRLLAENDETMLFDIANHLNNGVALITDDKERKVLSRLNLKAAILARDSGAYLSAQSFVEFSIKVTEADAWKDDLDFALSQARTQAEIEYLNGNIEQSEKLFFACLDKIPSVYQKSSIYYMLMQNQNSVSRYIESLQNAREVLTLLDFELPASDKAAESIPAEMGKVIEHFTTHGVASIFDKPVMTDERALAIIQILDNVSPPAYLSGETNLWVLHVLLKVNLTIEYGLSPEGGYAFSELGLIFFIQGAYNFGPPCAELSMRLTEKFRLRSPRHLSRAGHIVTNYNMPWVKHFSEILRLNHEYYQISLDSGELIFAGYTSLYPLYTSLYLGNVTVDSIVARVPEALDFNSRIKHVLAHNSTKAIKLVLENLAGRTEQATEFRSDNLDDATLMASCQEAKDWFSLAIFNVYKAHALHLHGEHDAALLCIDAATSLAAVMYGSAVVQTMYNYTHSLALIATARRDSALVESTVVQVEANQTQLQLWAEHNKENFQHKYLFVSAELAGLKGEHAQAALLYNEAIADAEQNEFVRDAGLIHLRAGEFWLKQNVPLYAQSHFDVALRIFESLGYHRVAANMKREQAEHLTTQRRGTVLQKTITELSTTTMPIESLDMDSVVKTARALSESLEMDSLIERMLQIIIENAGAQRAVLVVQEFGSWKISAEYDIDGGSVRMHKNVALDANAEIPVSIVNFVIRTNTAALSNAESMQKIMDRDQYIKKYRPSSFICLPLVHKGITNAILYAEHRTGTNFLNDERLEVIEMLTSQMAVSLENAALYKRQQELITASQKFVPADFIKALGRQNLLQVQLGDGISKDMTVMFADIRSYSSLAEGLSVEENFKFINAYLALVGPVIRKNNGFINHYHGDGFIALFTQDPADALNASLQILQAMESFNHERAQKNTEPIKLGIGIHTGPVMMGIIGDGERQDANVISDAVNTASRLEGMTKTFGSTVIISEQTLQQIGDPDQFQTRFIGKVRMVGKEEVITVHELFNADEYEMRAKKQKTLEMYNKALNEYFKKEFAESAKTFKKVVDSFPEDNSSRRYLENATRHHADGVDSEWQGVETLSVK